MQPACILLSLNLRPVKKYCPAQNALAYSALASWTSKESVWAFPAGRQRDEAHHRDGGEETPGANVIKLFAVVI